MPVPVQVLCTTLYNNINNILTAHVDVILTARTYMLWPCWNNYCDGAKFSTLSMFTDYWC